MKRDDGMSEVHNGRFKVEASDVLQYLFGKYNDHQIHCVINFYAHIDVNCLKRAVDLSVAIVPLLRCRFVEKSGRPYWQEGGYTADDMVKLVDSEPGRHQIQRLLTAKTEEFEGPQLKVNVIRNKEFDALCVIVNHMVCDAAGFKEYLYLLGSIYTHIKDHPDYRPDGAPVSRSLNQVFRRFGPVDKIKILFDRYDMSKHNSNAVFQLEGDNNNPFILTHTISRQRFHALKAYARKYHATMNDMILSAYIRTLQGVLGGPPVVPCAVDLRKYLPGRKAEGICNLTSNMLCDIGRDIGVDFDDTLLKVKRAMDSEKRKFACLNAVLLLNTLFELLPYKTIKKLMEKKFINPPIAMTNIGVIDKSRLIFDNIEITGAFMTGSIKYKPYFQLALTTFDDEVTFSINFHGTQQDKQRIQSFLLKLDKELPC
jgi:NRPS condensation-like uncharacterized protein